MKQRGCRDMSAEECALALQLYRDGALLRSIAAEVGRCCRTVGDLVRATGAARGHAFRTRGPRRYLVDRLMDVVWIKNPCDCQHPETTPEGFAAVSTSCPFHGDDALWPMTLESCP